MTKKPMGRPTNASKGITSRSKQFCIKLQPDMREEVDSLAKGLGVSRTAFIEQALRVYLVNRLA